MTAAEPERFPVLIESRCRGTGDCVAACPTACLDMAADRPWLARPAQCIACGVCAEVCPTAAIRMPSA